MPNTNPLVLRFNVYPVEEVKKFKDRLCEAFRGAKEFVDTDIVIGAEYPNYPNEVLVIMQINDDIISEYTEISKEIHFDHQ